MITDPDGRLADLATKDGTVLKKRVLTDAGEDLGSVRDIDLDPETGALTALVVGDKKNPGRSTARACSASARTPWWSRPSSTRLRRRPRWSSSYPLPSA